MAHSDDVTQLLQAWSTGDGGAGERLMALVYDELRALSGSRLNAHGGPVTMQATELISEAYLRLSAQNSTNWQNRKHFFAIAATVMRRVLLDQARRRHSAKRDRRLESGHSPDEIVMSSERAEQLLALDTALERLQALSPRQAKIIELRYFGGLSIPEAAASLDVSEATIKRDWVLARAWLLNQVPMLGEI